MSKRYHKKDPFAKREAQKYEKPIPSRELILDYLEGLGKAVSYPQLVKAFALKDPDMVDALSRRLRAMEREGQLLKNRRGNYAVVSNLDLIPGFVIGRKDGYGFFRPNDGGEDIYLSPVQMRQVFPGDEVLVQVTGEDRRGRREGAIVEILEYKTQSVVGQFAKESGVCFVIPNDKEINHDVIIPKDKTKKAQIGQFVVANVVTQPTTRRQATGEIAEILGDAVAPGIETEVAIRSYGIRHHWPAAIDRVVSKMPTDVKSKDIKGRKDLRDLAFVTIDGADAKDFDDAVYCEKSAKGGWRLFVAIADVTHYLQSDSALDKEAFARGNSVYFPTRVIPMLPEVLSNGLCSLKPKVDRLVLVCEMNVDADGKMERYQFYEAVIHSHARLMYSEVAKILEDDDKKHTYYKELKELHHLFKRLHKQRASRGALDFVTTETRIIFDEQKIKNIIPVERNDAHKLIEECMLLANVATAKFLLQHKMPVLYRVHEGPTEEKLLKLREFLNGVGLRLRGGDNPTSKDYANLLDRLDKRPDSSVIQTVLLRSLSQAVYTPKNAGHFGLAYEAYCHFTSPIRRYPDVIVHRAIKHVLQNQPVSKFPHTQESMAEFGTHFSKTERNADWATREVVDWLKCEYMKDNVGKVYDGIICDITGFGAFVELKDVYVQGLLHITAMVNDYYHYDAAHHRLVGKHSNTRYRLGDQIKVCVSRVNIEQREIDFVLP